MIILIVQATRILYTSQERFQNLSQTNQRNQLQQDRFDNLFFSIYVKSDESKYQHLLVVLTYQTLN